MWCRIWYSESIGERPVLAQDMPLSLRYAPLKLPVFLAMSQLSIYKRVRLWAQFGKSVKLLKVTYKKHFSTKDCWLGPCMRLSDIVFSCYVNSYLPLQLINLLVLKSRMIVKDTDKDNMPWKLKLYDDSRFYSRWVKKEVIKTIRR